MNHDEKSTEATHSSGVPEGNGRVDQASIHSDRAHNVVDALYKHFKKWRPEILKDSPSKVEDAS